MYRSPSNDNKDVDLSIVKEEYKVQIPKATQSFKSTKISSFKGIEHKCSVCGLVFLSMSQLSIHMKIHSSLGALGDFNCTLCPRTFRFKQALEEHQLRVHSSKTAPVPNTSGFSKITKNTRKKAKTLVDKPTIIATSIESQKPQQDHKSVNIVPKLEENFVAVGTTTKNIKQEDAQKSTKRSANLLNSRIFECDQCEKKFKSEPSIRMHIRLIHEGKKSKFAKDYKFRPYYCREDRCGKTFRNHGNYLAHLEKHTTVKMYECPKCLKKYPSRDEIIEHLRDHMDGLVCNICHKEFTLTGRYWRHMIGHTRFVKHFVPCEPDVDALACKTCNKTFEDSNKLKIHLRHRKKITCKLCNKTINEVHKKKHMRISHSVQGTLKRNIPKVRIKCKFCEKTFFKRLIYEKHSCFRNNVDRFLKDVVFRKPRKTIFDETTKDDIKNSKPNPPEKLFECEICEQNFPSKMSITIHIHKSHVRPEAYKNLLKDDDGHFQCDICMEKLPFDALREHMKQEGRNDYPCNLCGGLFRTEFDLKGHKFAHKAVAMGTLEKVQCPKCPRIFFFKGNLRKHVALHKENVTEDGDHVCRICGKKFEHLANLKVHYKRHRMEILECDKCGKLLKGKAAFKRHIGVVHFGMSVTDFTGQKNPCGHCGKVFNSRYILERHLISHITTRPFQCEQCKKTFKEQCALNRHIKIVHEFKTREYYKDLNLKVQDECTKTELPGDSEEGCIKSEMMEVKTESFEIIQVKEECN